MLSEKWKIPEVRAAVHVTCMAVLFQGSKVPDLQVSLKYYFALPSRKQATHEMNFQLSMIWVVKTKLNFHFLNSEFRDCAVAEASSRSFSGLLSVKI